MRKSLSKKKASSRLWTNNKAVGNKAVGNRQLQIVDNLPLQVG